MGEVIELQIHAGLKAQADSLLAGGGHKVPVVETHHGGHVGAHKAGHAELVPEHIGEDFANHFSDKGITKVVTIESSGIAPALMAAAKMNVPLVILKKQPSKTLHNDLYQTQVTSFTTEKSYELTLSRDVISEDDNILLIDDFMADGEAATGAIRLLRMAHATVAGIGILIEKSFQPGRRKINEQGYEVYSLARIKYMDEYQIDFIEEN